MQKLLIFTILICLMIISGCKVLINPEAKIIVKDSNSNVIKSNQDLYDFGDVLINTPQNEIFTILNLGKKTLELTGTPIVEISGIDSAYFTIITQPTSEIDSNKTSTFELMVNVSEYRTYNASITIMNNDIDENPYTFNVIANGVAPEISVFENSTEIPSGVGSIDFGKIIVGESSLVKSFGIENIGTSALNLTGTPDLIEISGIDSAMFIIYQQTTKSVILPGETTYFTITFLPFSIRGKSATVIISNDDADENPYTFELKGEGITAPEINVKQGATTIPSDIGSYDFGEILINESSLDIEFTIENLGTVDLFLVNSPSIINIDGSDKTMFNVNDSGTVTPIHFESTTYFTISFNPTSPGIKEATISIYSNDYDENPYTFSITGTCIIPEINVKQGTDDIPSGTGSYDFGTVDVGSTSPKIEFTIENLGKGNLILNGTPKIQISGSNSSLFVIDQSTTLSVIPYNNSTTFGITFEPTIAANISVTVTIYNNDYDENPYTFTLLALSKSYDWTKVIGGSLGDMITDITQDSSGNIFITGYFDASVNFGADFGVTDNKYAQKMFTYFVTKINANLTYGWTKVFYATYNGCANILSILTDPNDNIFISGQLTGSMDFGKDFNVTDVKTSLGFQDCYICKINSNGTYGWTKTFGSAVSLDLGNDACTGIVLDSLGNMYATGSFQRTVNFGKDFSVIDNKISNGEIDSFLMKINSNGTYGWTKQFGGIGNDNSKAITIDSKNNIYITGYYSDSVNFGADFVVSDTKVSNGHYDCFVTRINSNGTYGWTKVYGGSYVDVVNSIITDNSDNIIISGHFRDTVNFRDDFGGSDIKVSNGISDCFIQKITNNGSYIWTKHFGGTGDDVTSTVVIDSSDNIYVCGSFYNTVNFGADFSSSDNKTSLGYSDCFVTKITNSGSYIWTKQIGGTEQDFALSMVTDSNGYVFIAGFFTGTVNFGADFYVSDIRTSNGHNDGFLTRIMQ